MREPIINHQFRRGAVIALALVWLAVIFWPYLSRIP